MSVDRFADLFREELESSGWQTFGGVMCPEHARPRDLLGDMPPPDAEGVNWGHVGSLRHVIAMLKEIETHMEGASQCPAN